MTTKITAVPALLLASGLLACSAHAALLPGLLSHVGLRETLVDAGQPLPCLGLPLRQPGKNKPGISVH